MDDVWDETGTENDVISMTSAKHENNLKTAAFKTALDETDTETFLQQGFNEGFKEAAIKFRALGKCKVCNMITVKKIQSETIFWMGKSFENFWGLLTKFFFGFANKNFFGVC